MRAGAINRHDICRKNTASITVGLRDDTGIPHGMPRDSLVDRRGNWLEDSDGIRLVVTGNSKQIQHGEQKT